MSLAPAIAADRSGARSALHGACACARPPLARPRLAQSGRGCRGGQGRRHHRPRLDATGRAAACGDRGAQARGQGRARGHHVHHARAVLAPGQDAALRRRHHPRRASCAWCRRWKIPIRKWPGRGTRGCAGAGSRSKPVCRQEEARRAHIGHIRRVAEGRPQVLLKLAISADGKVGAAGRKPVAITGDAARTQVSLLRARNDAILVGIGTVLSDNPSLTCRLPGMMDHSPVRVVLDAELRVPLSYSVVATARETPTWVVCAPSASAMAEQVLRDKGRRGAPRRSERGPARSMRKCSKFWPSAASRA